MLRNSCKRTQVVPTCTTPTQSVVTLVADMLFERRRALTLPCRIVRHAYFPLYLYRQIASPKFIVEYVTSQRLEEQKKNKRRFVGAPIS